MLLEPQVNVDMSAMTLVRDHIYSCLLAAL